MIRDQRTNQIFGSPGREMERCRRDIQADVVRSLDKARVSRQQAEQVQNLIAEVSRQDSQQPITINFHLPAEQMQSAVPEQVQAKVVRERRDIDWVAIAWVGIPALTVLILASFVFISWMSVPDPPPPPIVHVSAPSCLFWC